MDKGHIFRKTMACHFKEEAWEWSASAWDEGPDWYDAWDQDDNSEIQRGHMEEVPVNSDKDSAGPMRLFAAAMRPLSAAPSSVAHTRVPSQCRSRSPRTCCKAESSCSGSAPTLQSQRQRPQLAKLEPASAEAPMDEPTAPVTLRPKTIDTQSLKIGRYREHGDKPRRLALRPHARQVVTSSAEILAGIPRVSSLTATPDLPPADAATIVELGPTVIPSAGLAPRLATPVASAAAAETALPAAAETEVALAVPVATEAPRLLPAMWQCMASPEENNRVLVYCRAIAASAEAREWRDAERLVYRMQAEGLRPSEQALNSLMDAYAQQADWRKAISLKDEMRRRCVADGGPRPNVDTYTAAARACARAGHSRKAEALLVELREVGLRPNTLAWNALVEAYARAGDWRRAVELKDAMRKGEGGKPKPDAATYTCAVAGCARAAEWRTAEGLLEEIQQEGLTPSPRATLALIKAYLACGEWSKALEAKSLVPHPSALIYTALITACAQAGRWREAQALLKELRETGHRPDVRTLNALVGAYASVGQLRKALARIEDMRRGGALCPPTMPKPDRGTYAAALGACAARGDRETAERLLREMRGEGIRPDKTVLNALLRVYLHCGEWRRALRAKDEMRRLSGSGPDVESYALCAQACGNANEWAKVNMLQEEMQSQGLVADSTIFDAIIKGCGESGNPQYVDKFLEEMHRQRLVPGVDTYVAAIRSFGTAGMLDEAERIFQRMQEDGTVPNVQAFAALIRACGRAGQWEQAIAEKDKMWKTPHVPNPDADVYLQVVEACGRCGRWRQAEAAAQEMREKGIALTVALHNALVHAYGEAGEWARAISAVEGAPEPPSAYVAAIEACARSKRCREAEALLREMRREVHRADQAEQGDGGGPGARRRAHGALLAAYREVGDGERVRAAELAARLATLTAVTRTGAGGVVEVPTSATVAACQVVL